MGDGSIIGTTVLQHQQPQQQQQQNAASMMMARKGILKRSNQKDGPNAANNWDYELSTSPNMTEAASHQPQIEADIVPPLPLGLPPPPGMPISGNHFWPFLSRNDLEITCILFNVLIDDWNFGKLYAQYKSNYHHISSGPSENLHLIG